MIQRRTTLGFLHVILLMLYFYYYLQEGILIDILDPATGERETKGHCSDVNFFLGMSFVNENL